MNAGTEENWNSHQGGNGVIAVRSGSGPAEEREWLRRAPGTMGCLWQPFKQLRSRQHPKWAASSLAVSVVPAPLQIELVNCHSGGVRPGAEDSVPPARVTLPSATTNEAMLVALLIASAPRAYRSPGGCVRQGSAKRGFPTRSNVPLWNAKVDGFGNHDPGSG